jgi:ribosomal protein S18 acetylase RimI-like enzyme
MRKAENSDVADIVRVHVETWRQAYSGLVPEDFLTAMLTDLGSPKRFEFWQQQITHPDSRFFVASDDGRVIGWIQAGKSRDDDSPDESEIYAVYVLPSYWRQGIGSELIARVHLEVPEMNATTLWVLRDNQRAIDFYNRLGYYPDGATKEMTAGEAVLTEIRMRKEPNKSAQAIS